MQHEDIIIPLVRDAMTGDLAHLRLDTELLLRRLHEQGETEWARKLQKILDRHAAKTQMSLWEEGK